VEEEEEESKTAFFQIPTYSLVIIFPSLQLNMSERCNLWNINLLSHLLNANFTVQLEFPG
jgi:hypothetical protein